MHFQTKKHSMLQKTAACVLALLLVYNSSGIAYAVDEYNHQVDTAAQEERFNSEPTETEEPNDNESADTDASEAEINTPDESSNGNEIAEEPSGPNASEATPSDNALIVPRATTSNISYLDENGTKKSTSGTVTVIDSNSTSWSNGWYVVQGNVTISSRVTVSGSVNLILADGASLTATSGIQVSSGNSLAIYAQSTGNSMGSLKSEVSTQGPAAIGGNDGESAGTITINGGDITAQCAGNHNNRGAAAIGGGQHGNGGTTTINGGKVSAKGAARGAGIGGGSSGDDGKDPITDGGTITINGGTVIAKSGDTTTSGSAAIGGGYYGSSGTIKITGGTVEATGSKLASGIGSGRNNPTVNVTISGGNITAKTQDGGAGIGSGSEAHSDSASSKITITGGTIDTSGSPGGGSQGGSAGIGGGTTSNGGTISIANATITATGANGGAGIGSGSNANNKSITISNAQVTAAGSNGGAGIGSGSNATSITITIQNNSRVTATSDAGGAGIGGGSTNIENGGKGNSSHITISDSTVNATSNAGAGIGGGNGYGRGGVIDISNSTVTATALNADPNWRFSAGIGDASFGDSATITINGGVVVAKGGKDTNLYGGPGIGGSESKITINSGNVTAVGYEGSAGIGSRAFTQAGSTKINGGNIQASCVSPSTTALSGLYPFGSAIGAGASSSGGSITITNGTVVAKTGRLASAIGLISADANHPAPITISGGDITAEGPRGIGGGAFYNPPVAISITGGHITIKSSDGVAITAQECSASYKSPGYKWRQSENATFSSNDFNYDSLKDSSNWLQSGYLEFLPSDATFANGISIDQSSAEIYIGKTLSLKATVNPSNYSLGYTWSSSNSDVATVNSSGVVTGVSAGKATITVGAVKSDGSVTTAMCQVTVKKYDQTTAPEAPTVSSQSANAITLNTITSSGGFGNIEYACVKTTDKSKAADNWQSSPKFEGLDPASSYTFYARYAGDNSYNASPASTGTTIWTTYATPAEDEGYAINYTSEQIEPTNGYEVRLNDGDTWSSEAITITPGNSFQVRHCADSSSTEGKGAPASESITATTPSRPAAPSLSIDNKQEGVIVEDGYAYNLSSANYDDEDWTTGDGSLVKIGPEATLHVYVKATKDAFKSEVQTITAPSRENTPEVPAIDYAHETLHGVNDTIEWSTDYTTWKPCREDMSLADLGWDGDSELTVSFRSTATGSTYASEPIQLEIPARPAAPTLSIDNIQEGVLIDSEYCYNFSNADYAAEGWSTGDGSLVPVDPDGVLYIYTKATDSTFNSQVQTLTAPSRENAPEQPTIDYADEILTGVDDKIEWSTDGTAWTKCSENMPLVDLGWDGNTSLSVSFRTVATDSAYASEPITLEIPARPEAPTLSIDNAQEGIAVEDGYAYNLSSADYAAEGWTSGDGSLVKIEPEGAIHVYAEATQDIFKSQVQTITAPGRENVPEIPTLDYSNEALNGMSSSIEWSTDNSTWTTCSENMPLVDFGWDGNSDLTVFFRTAATDTAYASEPIQLEISARPAAPEVHAVDESMKGASDGKLTGFIEGISYEISTDGGKKWTDITLSGTEIDNLAAGTYLVRVKATDSAFASQIAEMVINEGPVPTPETENPLDDNGGQANGSKSGVPQLSDPSISIPLEMIVACGVLLSVGSLIYKVRRHE